MTDSPKPKPPVKAEPKTAEPVQVAAKPAEKKKPYVPKPHLTQRPFRELAALKKQL